MDESSLTSRIGTARGSWASDECRTVKSWPMSCHSSTPRLELTDVGTDCPFYRLREFVTPFWRTQWFSRVGGSRRRVLSRSAAVPCRDSRETCVTHERASLRSRETPTAAVRSCGRVGGRGLAGSTPRVVSPPEGTMLGSAKPFAVDLRSRATRLLVRRVSGGSTGGDVGSPKRWASPAARAIQTSSVPG